MKKVAWKPLSLRIAACLIGIGCFMDIVSASRLLNNPHKHPIDENIRYGAFIGAPKTLDPARAYSSDESQFLAQIYEPPLQYHYLKRPYTLEPLSAAKMPTVTYLDANNLPLPANVDPNKVAYSVYDIEIKPGVFYQPHPAFAKDEHGQYRYHQLSLNDIKNKRDLTNFAHSGTRELTAEDFVYQIKRIANPKLSSPIYGVMRKYIVGLDQFADQLRNSRGFIDLRHIPLEGAKVIDRTHYQIKIKGYYPQFQYWLAMPFFAPIPWEADYFYSQPGMVENNLSFSWHPVGTGPYYLSENNPNSHMVLTRNPNFHGERYPTEGEPQDKAKGYLDDAGKMLPFVDQFVFSLDKESIPRWNKFLQGYYDKSGISADSFDQAIRIQPDGTAALTKELKDKGITLRTTVNPSIYYLGFNMLDDVVGGNSERARKLRQAIAIAIDYEEFVSIFMNGRGIPAQSPIPPGLFGYQKEKAGMNPVVYEWDNGKAKRKPLEVAKRLLAEAGYPNGRDPNTGRQLILHYDVAGSGNPDDRAQLDWMRKQFAKIGIRLNIRSTQYNRFQDKVRRGNAQIFSWGWLADYPDPENFLFLLYGPNGKVKHGGENASNYANAEFDRLFALMKTLPNNEERQRIIQKMLGIVRNDSPWVFGFHPIDFTLSHRWNRPSKPHGVANNLLKYERLDPALRHQLVKQWNSPMTWPLWALLAFIILLMLPLTWTYWRREKRPGIKRRQ